MQNSEFLAEERAMLEALKCRLAMAAGALELAFLRRQYAQALASLQTAEQKIAPGKLP